MLVAVDLRLRVLRDGIRGLGPRQQQRVPPRRRRPRTAGASSCRGSAGPRSSCTSARRPPGPGRGRGTSRHGNTIPARKERSARRAACPAGADPGRVHDEAPSLAYSRKPSVSLGARGSAFDRSRTVVGDDDREHAAEVPPGGLEPGDHRLEGLAERQPHERVAAYAAVNTRPYTTRRRPPPGREAGRACRSRPGARRRVPVGDPDRRGAAPEPEFGDRVPVERPYGTRSPRGRRAWRSWPGQAGRAIPRSGPARLEGRPDLAVPSGRPAGPPRRPRQRAHRRSRRTPAAHRTRRPRPAR